MSEAWDTGTGALPAYPNGWYALAFADEVGEGEVLPRRAFGRELVLYRGRAGVPAVVDAHCPHMGAHLGHGGRVCDDDLVCPFHGWRWSREGACVDVPAASPPPPGNPLRTWPCRDRNGFVYVWNHAGGEAPTWEVEEVPESSDTRYRITGRKVWPPFASHPQELSENGVDLSHFDTIHKFETRGIDWRPEGHAYSLAYDIEPLDTGLGGDSQYQLESYTEGPSCTRTRFSGSLEGITMHSCLPIDPGLLTVRSLYLFRNDVSDEAAQRVFENSQTGWAADIEIWSHKVYREKPLLSEAERLVPEFRRWFSQFY
jgi:phenylpropionate dioxygenase-like ring-hydroxylating dioxygenase large terminal subunit